ncbi:MAG: hypothetical protein K0S65_3471 [Labilithrix sp.]|nr:hypothetical protein [Labilithrix sp.]
MPKVLTQFSSHANTIADTFRAAFVKTKLGECTVEMTAPEESTRGGLYGLQHATLRSPSGMAIVAGSVHAGEKRAELRAFGLVSQLYAERFKQPPQFTEAEYGAFLTKAEPILAAFGLDVKVIAELPKGRVSDPPEPVTPSLPPGAARKRMVTWVLFLIAVLVIAGGGLFWGWRSLGR